MSGQPPPTPRADTTEWGPAAARDDGLSMIARQLGLDPDTAATAVLAEIVDRQTAAYAGPYRAQFDHVYDADGDLLCEAGTSEDAQRIAAAMNVTALATDEPSWPHEFDMSCTACGDTVPCTTPHQVIVRQWERHDPAGEIETIGLSTVVGVYHVQCAPQKVDAVQVAASWGDAER